MLKSRTAQVHLTGLLLGAVYLAVLLGTAQDIGFARDEGFYFSAARSYQRWFDVLADDPSQALTKEAIDKYWRYNHEHPALMKTAFGFSERIFNKSLNLLAPSTAMRLPGMLTAALLVYLLFVIGAATFGRRAGFFAAAFFALMPRVFYHAHLTCFDVPMTLMWLAVTYLYWRSLSSKRFGIAAGVVFGLALCTKLNAFFLPFILGLHYGALFIYRRRRKETIPKPWAFLFGAVLAPLIFLAHWPWLWTNTFPRLVEYMGFHSNHPHYNTEWLGENVYKAPTPILLPIGMTLFTIPTTIVVLALAGIVMRLRHHLPPKLEATVPKTWQPTGPMSKDGLDLLLLIAGGFPIALISLPNVPIFGGTKHWMPAFPFIALLAGLAAVRLVDVMRERLSGVPAKVAAVLLGALLIAPAAQQTASSHPFGLASYVPFIGGAPGAATIGLTRQFWGYTTRSVIPWLNKTYPNGARLEIHDTAHPAFHMFHEDGTLKRSIRAAKLSRSNVALLHHELHMIYAERWIWDEYHEFIPTFVLTYHGVPMVSVYTR